MRGYGDCRRRKIGIVIDNPRRDLRGLVLLAYLFAIRRCQVYLIPMYQQGYDIPQLKLDLVIANYVRESNRDLLCGYKEMGVQVAILDTEGGILSESGLDSPITWAASLRQSGMTSLVDYYCFWGQSVRTAFAEHSGLPVDRLAVTGCPRYDVCAEPWSAVLHYPRQGHILFNTNFSAINPAYTKSADDERKIFESLGWEKTYIDKLFVDLHTVFPRYLDTIEAVALNFPDRLIQVRPHPFENSRAYITRFQDIPNIVVDAEGDILNAIAEADCTVHLNCGSSVDAIFLGKVPISIEYLNTERMRSHAPLPSSLSCLAGSQQQLFELIGNLSTRANIYDINEAKAKVKPWYFKNDGCASERVVNFLLEGLSKEPSPLGSAVKQQFSREKDRRHKISKGQQWQKIISAVIGTAASSRISEMLRPHRVGKRIPLPLVADLLAQYAQCSGGKTVTVHRACSPKLRLNLASYKIECDD